MEVSKNAKGAYEAFTTFIASSLNDTAIEEAAMDEVRTDTLRYEHVSSMDTCTVLLWKRVDMLSGHSVSVVLDSFILSCFSII